MLKRGQAAMEFLMTYGWAILIIILLVAAFYYFYTPKQYLTACILPAGFICKDFTIGKNGAEFLIENDLGHDIRNIYVNIEVPGVTCTNSGIVDLNNGDTGDFSVICNNINLNKKFSGNIIIKYTKTDSSLPGYRKGTLSGGSSEQGIPSGNLTILRLMSTATPFFLYFDYSSAPIMIDIPLYSIQNLSLGKHRILVTAPEYQDYSQSITILEGSNTLWLDFGQIPLITGFNLDPIDFSPLLPGVTCSNDPASLVSYDIPFTVTLSANSPPGTVDFYLDVPFNVTNLTYNGNTQNLAVGPNYLHMDPGTTASFNLHIPGFNVTTQPLNAAITITNGNQIISPNFNCI